MNTFNSAQLVMRGFYRLRDKYPAYYSVPADAKPYGEVILPYLDPKKEVVLDVGCGDGELWSPESPLSSISNVLGVDLLGHTAWHAVASTALSRNQRVVFMMGWPAMIPRTDMSLYAVLVKNVLPFFSVEEDYLRLFWSLPSNTGTLLVSQPSLPYAGNSSAVFNSFGFKKLAVHSWEDSAGIVWFTSVVQQFGRQWRSIANARWAKGVHEPCPDCHKTGIDVDKAQIGTTTFYVCPSCGYHTTLKTGDNPSEETIFRTWNAFRVADYTMSETHLR